jgi:hypothetical protein
MKQFELKGIITTKGQPTLQFTVIVNANDQASARRLVMMQYSPQGQVTINNLKQVKSK